MTETTPPAWVERIRLRIVADVIREATAAHWRHRAATFEWVRPRPSDWSGHASPAELAHLDTRTSERASACRNHARFLASLHHGTTVLEEAG